MKTKSFVAILISVVSGFGLGYVCADIATGDENGKGDITKVSKYSKNVVSPQASAFQEQILNDPQVYDQTRASLVVLSSRMNDFDNLVDIAVKSGNGIDELAPAIAQIKRISDLSANAKNAAVAAADSFNGMIEGKKASASDYETASRNLTLAYLMVDRQLNVGKEYVSSVDAYLKGRKIEDNLDLALSRDLWAGYCAGQAVLNNDKDDLAYWSGKNAIVNTDVLANVGTNINMVGLLSNQEEIVKVLGLVADNNSLLGLGQSNVFGLNVNLVEFAEMISHNAAINANVKEELLGLLAPISNHEASVKAGLSANEKVLSANEVVLSANEKVLSANEVVLSDREKTLHASETQLLGIQTNVLENNVSVESVLNFSADLRASFDQMVQANFSQETMNLAENVLQGIFKGDF